MYARRTTSVLAGAVVPLREPSGVNVRAKLPSDVKPSVVEERIEETPVSRDEGAALADQVVEALDEVHRAERVG
jgi:hypothetical protein